MPTRKAEGQLSNRDNGDGDRDHPSALIFRQDRDVLYYHHNGVM